MAQGLFGRGQAVAATTLVLIITTVVVDGAICRSLAGPGCLTLTQRPGRAGPAAWQQLCGRPFSWFMTGATMAISNYIPPKFPHKWLPEKVELKTWEQIEPWYRQLLAMSIASASDLERWLVAAGELNWR